MYKPENVNSQCKNNCKINMPSPPRMSEEQKLAQQKMVANMEQNCTRACIQRQIELLQESQGVGNGFGNAAVSGREISG